MTGFNLELILEGTEETAVELPVNIHVHKRLEQFLYLNSIREDAAPIAYLGNPTPDAWRNLLVVNKSHCVVANSPSLFAGERRFDTVVSSSYSSPYSSIVATNEFTTDSKGKKKPLFFRHELPEGVVEATLQEVSAGNKDLVDEGYQVDTNTRSIYTNYQNKFDPQSGTYRLFFVNATASDGTVVNTLLNAQPVAKEATWEDNDLTTGELTEDYPLYSKERSGRGYTYYFNQGTRWYIRPQEKGLIQPRRPQAKRPDSGWYIRFTNGDVSAVVNDTTRRYYIPEFNTQPFIPYNPIKYGTWEDLLLVNRRVLAATRRSLEIDPSAGLHLEIHIEDEEGNLVRVYTTDDSKHGARYGNTGVFYESDRISSWDNQSGFIHLALDVFPNWVCHAKYYYSAEDYEYTLVNLNPITNKKLRDHMYVFYCVPDVNEADRAIHHLVVNQHGVIVECSQSEGIGHPNLQLHNTDGSYNSETIIGRGYAAEEGNFLREYAAGFDNDNGYLVLAEVCGIDPSLVEDQLVVDLRRPGGVIDPEMFEEAIGANPRILQSHLGYGPEGQVVPEVNVVVLEPQISLLQEYGGLLTEDQVGQLLRTYMPASGYAVINYAYPRCDISGYSFTNGEVNVDLTWEGTYTYRLYRRPLSSSEWELINTEVDPPEGTISYVDQPLTSDAIYEYVATVVENGIEYPFSDIIAVKVR